MEHHEGQPRFWGRYMGYVRNADDPEERGRLRCFVPEVLGGADNESNWLDWALPSFPWFAEKGVGLNFIPPARDAWGVWVEFRQGDLRFPVWTGVFPLTKVDKLKVVLRALQKIELGQGATEALVLGTSYRSAEDSMLSTLRTQLLAAGASLVLAGAPAPSPFAIVFSDTAAKLLAAGNALNAAAAAIVSFESAAAGNNQFKSEYAFTKRLPDSEP